MFLGSEQTDVQPDVMLYRSCFCFVSSNEWYEISTVNFCSTLMKLALKLSDVGNFKRILGFVLSVRKQCIFKFKANELNIISVDRESPLIWGTIGSANFSRFDVIAKDECIGLELNVEPLFQIMKNFEKAPVTSDLIIKLQRGEESNTPKDNSSKRKRPVFLHLSYNEDITCTSEISHSFSIPVSLLRGKLIERIQMPPIHNVELIADMNQTLISFFMRIERYKAIDNINVVMNRLGEIKIELKDEGKKISLKWKSLLDTCSPEEVDALTRTDTETPATHVANNQENNDIKNKDLNMIKEITVKVKSRWWNLASKLIELCDTLQMYIYEDGCVFNCHVEDEQSCSLLYYLPGKLLD